MIEIGIESSLLHEILQGNKTIEGRLGKPKFLRLRKGDSISLREDIWKNGELILSKPNSAVVTIKQLLYFETFEEMLSAVDYKAAIPFAVSKADAINIYKKIYSPEEELEFGVIAIFLSNK